MVILLTFPIMVVITANNYTPFHSPGIVLFVYIPSLTEVSQQLIQYSYHPYFTNEEGPGEGHPARK